MIPINHPKYVAQKTAKFTGNTTPKGSDAFAKEPFLYIIIDKKTCFPILLVFFHLFEETKYCQDSRDGAIDNHYRRVAYGSILFPQKDERTLIKKENTFFVNNYIQKRLFCRCIRAFVLF